MRISGDKTPQAQQKIVPKGTLTKHKVVILKTSDKFSDKISPPSTPKKQMTERNVEVMAKGSQRIARIAKQTLKF